MGRGAVLGVVCAVLEGHSLSCDTCSHLFLRPAILYPTGRQEVPSAGESLNNACWAACGWASVSGTFPSPPPPRWRWWWKKRHITFLPASLLWRFMRARLDEAPLLLSRTSTNDWEKATP